MGTTTFLERVKEGSINQICMIYDEMRQNKESRINRLK